MSINVPLEEMSIEEKIQRMETIWESLCAKADSMVFPPWHEKVLNEREERLRQGDDEFIDWDSAKKDIRNDIP